MNNFANEDIKRGVFALCKTNQLSKGVQYEFNGKVYHIQMIPEALDGAIYRLIFRAYTANKHEIRYVYPTAHKFAEGQQLPTVDNTGHELDIDFMSIFKGTELYKMNDLTGEPELVYPLVYQTNDEGEMDFDKPQIPDTTQPKEKVFLGIDRNKPLKDPDPLDYEGELTEEEKAFYAYYQGMIPHNIDDIEQSDVQPHPLPVVEEEPEVPVHRPDRTPSSDKWSNKQRAGAVLALALGIFAIGYAYKRYHSNLPPQNPGQGTLPRQPITVKG